MSKYKNKYNFDINTLPDEEGNKQQQVIHIPDKTITTTNIPYKEEGLRVVIEKQPPKEEIQKIKADSKTYYQNLKRKVILSHKMCQIFLDNFYADEFTFTRRSTYFLFGFPLFVGFAFRKINPYHPLLGVSLNIALLTSMITFGYFLKEDINYLSHLKYHPIGVEIRMIKNEMVLYNSLAKPIMDKDLNADEEEKFNQKKEH